MNFNNAFEVSLPPNEAWPFLMDVERVIPCMPGAELLQIIDDKTFKGKISVKLGPVLLTFTCDASFVDVDPIQHSARINAQGVDAKGRGGVKSSIHFHLEPSGSGSKVMIDTDLSMSGAVAQYGRGASMMQSVANQVISQFSANLEASIAADRQALAASPSGTTPTHTDSTGNAPVSGPAPRPSAKPISGFALLFAALLRGIRNWFGRKPST
jgi:carbon monoxide dehydrogenase subunit G